MSRKQIWGGEEKEKEKKRIFLLPVDSRFAQRPGGCRRFGNRLSRGDLDPGLVSQRWEKLWESEAAPRRDAEGAEGTFGRHEGKRNVSVCAAKSPEHPQKQKVPRTLSPVHRKMNKYSL